MSRQGVKSHAGDSPGRRESDLYKRLVDSISSNPERGGRIIGVLVVAVIILSAGLTVTVLAFAFSPEPGYPSEDTPLSLVGDDSVAWSLPASTYYDSHPLEYGSNYSGFAWAWVWRDDNGSTGRHGMLANESQQEALSGGSPVSVVVWDWTGIGRRIEIIEAVGDGFFGPGDSIVFHNSTTLIPEDYVPKGDVTYTLGLVFLGVGIDHWGEYSYSIDGDELASWRSSFLDWTLPWYHSLMDD
jgi:hypothetical protein